MRANRMWPTLAASALLAVALPAFAAAQASVSTDRKAALPDTTDQALVQLLTKANTDEIAAGRSALSTTQNAEVRRFAQKMVDDHTKAMDRLNSISGKMGTAAMAMAPAPADTAMGAGVARDSMRMPSPDSGMGAGAMADSSRMRATGAPSGDRQFIDAMVTGHQQLLGKLPEDGRGVKDKDLRKYVGDVRKTVKSHYDEARALQTKMGGMEKP